MTEALGQTSGSARVPAPVLTPGMLRSELARLLQKERRSYLVAFFGAGEPGEVLVNARRFRVVPTRSELDLRAKLPERVDADTPGTVYLVDWTESLPLDIACRLASGRLQRINRDTRIAALFGARDVDPLLLGSNLARVLLVRPALSARLLKVPGQLLQREDAYARFLHALADLPLDALSAVERFLAFCCRNPNGSALGALDEGAGLSDEVAAFVEEKLGPLARAGFEAWTREQGTTFLSYWLLLDAVDANPAAAYARPILDDRLSALPYGPRLRQSDGARSPERLRLVLDELGVKATELLRHQALIPSRDFQADLVRSRFLPAGLDARLLLFDAALGRALAKPAELKALLEADAQIESHYLRPATKAEGRTMAIRLVAYLAEASTAQKPSPTSEYQAALDLAGRYRREGGFVDWARRRLRSIGEGPHIDAYRAVLAEVDRLRRAQDAAFAQGYAAWASHGKPATQVLPIEAVSKRVVAEFLSGGPHRRLLVVLMDGMSMSDMVQLLESAELESDRWSPAAWRPKGFDGLEFGLLPPVFAAPPTLTQVSRAAFFAGAFKPELGDQSTSEDRKRWAANVAVRKLLPDDVTPALLLKDELMSGGQLSAKAKELIAPDEDGESVVAVVINAIDDHLSGAKQVQVEWEVKDIPVLRSLLASAAMGERAVLLASDHGHVPGELLQATPGADKERAGARWRGLAPGEPAAQFEVVLSSLVAWAPKGCDRVALIWDERVTYGTAKNGEHGGAALAEVVAPCVLIVPDTLADMRPGAPDSGLQPAPRYEPTWWQLEVEAERPRAETAAPTKTKASAPTAQLPLGLHGGAPPSSVSPPLVEKLRATKLFKVQAERRAPAQVASALEALGLVLEQGGQLGFAEFARRAKLPSFRATGPLNAMAELLNVDQHMPVVVDHAGKQVTVNADMLAQLFEVKA